MNEKSLPRKLTRSRNDRYIGGVAAGIANRLSIDPIFVRIAFIASLAFGGLGLLAYAVLLAVLPVEGDPTEPLAPITPKRRNLMIGLAVVVGLFTLVTGSSGGFAGWFFGFWPGTVFGILFWVAAATVAVWLFVKGVFGRQEDDSTPAEPATSPVVDPSPVAEAGEATAADPLDETTELKTFADSPTQVPLTDLIPKSGSRTRAAEIEGSGLTGSTPTREGAPSVIGKIMLWFAIGLAALTVFCTLFVLSAGTTALFGGIPMAALVIVLGGGMVFAAVRGRRNLSLWILTAAIAVAIPMAVISIADLRVEGSYGDINERPRTTADIPEGGYKMAAGNMTIDLRKLGSSPMKANRADTHIDLPVTSGIGLTTVIVPDDMCVTGFVSGKAGLAYFRGHQTNGVNVDQGTQSIVGKLPSFSKDSSVTYLDGNFKLGAFEVVDDTEWKLTGGNLNQGEYARIETTDDYARERAQVACDNAFESTKSRGQVKP